MIRTRPVHAVSRAAVATLCSLALALPTTARAADPEPAPVDPASATDTLSPQAQEHVVKGYQHFKSGQYLNAEAAFRRAAFFAPSWRPLHFNLAVVAEAQGKLGTAVNEYRAFKPYAHPEEAMVAEQRIIELDDRRRRIGVSYKKQIAATGILMGVGVAAMGGGGALTGIGYARKKDDTDGKTDSATKMITGGLVLVLYGLLLAGSAFVPLSRAVKSKRQLDGLALGPTRLKWNGGLGATLKF